MARRRQSWLTRAEGDWTLGIIRDTARVGIPAGGVYNAIDVLLHRPGVAFKRGGIIQGTSAAGSGTGLIAASYANFPGIGFQKVAVTGDTFLVDELLTGSRVGHGVISGFTSIIDPPTLYVGGAHNVLVFCDSSGTEIPWFYNGGDNVQQFQGGNTGATGDYALTITGTPTGGGFALAAQDLVSGFSYLTAEIAFDAADSAVQSALEAAAPNTFACTGGSLPGSAVTITVPIDWAVSVIPAAISGFSLTGGTDPAISLGAVDGASTGVPTAIHSVSHLQRLILANSSVYPNRLWFGPLLNPTGAAWDTATSWIDMDQAVSAIASLSNVLLVFSYSTMWRITGDTPPPDSNMDIQPLSHVGCTDARSIALIDGQCIFANPRGVYVTTGIAPVSLMEGRIETYWQSLFSGYDPATWTISAGLYGRRFLVVTVLDDTDALVKTFLCDLTNRAWVELSQPRAKMYASAFGAEEELYAATMDFSYLQKLSGMFTPAIANAFDAIGSFGCTLETRPVPFSPTVKAFGDAHLTYDMRTSTPVVPNKVMKCVGSADVARVQFDFAGAEAEVWLSYRLGLTAPAITFFTDPGSGNSVQTFALRSGSTIADQLDLADPDIAGDLWFSVATGAQTSLPVPAVGWQTCKAHYVDGTLMEQWINGTSMWSVAADPAGDVDTFRLGLCSLGNNDAAAIAYFDDVTVGTTDGGTDIFSDDFSSGDLSAWTGNFGDVTVVNDPF